MLRSKLVRSIAQRSMLRYSNKIVKNPNTNTIKKKTNILTNPWSGKTITKKQYAMNKNTIQNVIDNYFT